MKRRQVILIMFSLFTGQACASQFAIQLEASRSPSLDRYQVLSVYGNLYTVATDNGYTRTRMGPYQSRKMAQNALDKISAAGYTDAFITRYANSDFRSNSAASMAINQQHDIGTFDVKTLKEWKKLTPQQQANLVYLDGKLHIKNGNQFTPLSDIIVETAVDR